MTAAPKTYLDNEIDVSVIMVTYNAADWTQRSLKAVPGGIQRHAYEVIVVDNASPEVHPSELKQWAGPSATVEFLPENIGFGRGCNYAATLARGRTVLLLNPDAVVEPFAIDELVEFLEEDPRRGVVGGRIFSPDGDLDYGSCFGKQTTWSMICFATGLSALLPRSRFFNPEGLGSWQRDSPREVGMITGCLLLCDADLWRQLDGFDDDFFMYGEDADLCRRAWDHGFRPSVTDRAQAVHALGESSSQLIDKQIMMYRGKVTLIKKHSHGLGQRFQLACLRRGVRTRKLMEKFVDKGNQWGELSRRESEWMSGW